MLTLAAGEVPCDGRRKQTFAAATDKTARASRAAHLVLLLPPHLPLCTPLPSPFLVTLSISCVYNLPSSTVRRAPAPDMVLSSTGPPGLSRPKNPHSHVPSPSPSHSHILSPIPTQPRTSWFQLLSSSPAPAPFPLPATAVTESFSVQPHVNLAANSKHSLSTHFDNNDVITNLSSSAEGNLHPGLNPADPWTRAHIRVCAHAKDTCAACSISLTCCSCRSLRYSPGLPPVSPTPPAHRSRSASPVLFRDVGNAPTPPGFCDESNPVHDDDAYARALAEHDTCDNFSCPRGTNEPATWTIIVEQFDEGAEEMYDRTFRACGACNRSCKRSFMTHKIKSRTFDNSTRKANAPPTPPKNDPIRKPASMLVDSSETLPAPAPTRGTSNDELCSNPPTPPLEAFAVISFSHRVSCSHVFETCSTCSLGIVCCGCNKLHTAPARLKLRCAVCHHFACVLCTTPFCCSCRKPWFPSDSPTLVLAQRFRGGARSTKSSKKGSSSSSQSSGPGSLATAHSTRNSPDPFAVPTAQVTQSSVDEINAFADVTVKLTDVHRHETSRAAAPSPSSNMPPVTSAPTPVFSRPVLPVVVGGTEDVPTAVPSRAPSRAASVASIASTGDAGVASPLQPDPFARPASPPALDDVVGRIHRRHPLASLKVDKEDSRHFLARDDTRTEDIANETEYLLSSATSWPTILYFMRDIMKFETIKGSAAEFQIVLAGLADVWSDAADFDAREILRNMIEAVRLMPKAEKEIDRLESTAQRYRTERQSARTQLKTTEAELSRLRQAANDTLDSNARLLGEIDQLRATDAVAIAQERDEAQLALKNAIVHSKAAMAKQVSRYQHLFSLAEERQSRLQTLEKEAEDKDAYILKTEAEHAELYRERESAERLAASLKQQLHDATNLFETTREARRHDQEDHDEKTSALKARISELNSRLNLLPSSEAELRAMVGMANERAGIAEEEYRKKSKDLKEAQKEISALKAKLTDAVGKPPTLAKATGSSKKEQAPTPPSKKVRWSFDPADDSSQPFWDHSNEYSRYIANMVAATVTALPNIPMQTAISTAIETVRAAGPGILSQPVTATKSPSAPTPKRPSSPNPAATSPSPSTTNPPRRSRAPSPSLPKPTPAPATSVSMPAASMTFAQMAATVLDPTTAAPMHPAKAKPTWRAIETNKSLVLRPGTKGTRVSELHIRVPKVAATAHLFSLSGTKLINEVLRLVNESHNKAGIRALKDNHLVLVKWSMRGNLIFKCSKPMDDVIKDCLHDAIKAAVPPGSADSIAILNKPPTTALKFSSVPRHNEDGTDTDSYDLLNDLMGNEIWRDVEIFSQPRFLPMKHDAAGGTVIVSVVDDNVGSVGRKLMNTIVNFSGATRRCLRWVEKEAQLHCTQCQGWGHLNFNCLSNIMRCSKCAGPHDFRQHDRYCETCKAGKGHLCIPRCFNCHGAHFANSKECIFYLNRSSKERQVQLRDEFSQKWKEEEAALKATANSDSGRAARTAAAIKDTQKKGKAKAQAVKRGDDDDYTPIGKGGKAKYTFSGMAKPLAPTTRINNVDEQKDSGNDSDSSSELRLSYVDDVPLSKRFPFTKPPMADTVATEPPFKKTPARTQKPLTITLPATGHKPSRSVTDILRELNKSTSATHGTNPESKDPLAPVTKQTTAAANTARFGGGDVTYSSSALAHEAEAFADALAISNVTSQPSPPREESSAPTAPVPRLDLSSDPRIDSLAPVHDLSSSTQPHA